MSSKRSKKKSIKVAPEVNPTIEVPETLAVENTTTVKAKVTKATTDKKARAAKAPVHRSRQKTEPAAPAPIAAVSSSSNTSDSEPAMAPIAPEPVGMTDMAALAHAVAPETMAYPHQEVAGLAYLYWEQRGRQHGSATEDWLRAEREVLSRSQRA
jgi:hypothetical protein